MAKTKVTGGYIADSAITSDHLHTTLDLSTKTLTIGAATVSGHLIPDTNITYDLGSSTNRFRDIYLDGTTINLGGTELKKNDAGDIEFKSGSNFKRLVVSELEFDDGTNRKKFKIDSGRIKSFDSSGVSDTADKISLSSNTTDDLGEGSSNLYFTTARADARISAASIGDLSDIDISGVTAGQALTWSASNNRFEPTTLGSSTDSFAEGSSNLYFTTARAREAISVSGNALSYNSSTGVLTANYEESPSFTGNVTVSGTISSGAITSSGVIAAGAVARMYTSSDRGYFVAGTNDSSNQHLYLGSYHGTTLKELTFSGSNNAFYPQTSEAIDLGLSTKKFKNLQLSGTISSGAITSTGAIQGASFSDGTISGITFIDEDSFSTNSATRVPTQQSIKAYVDAQVAGVVDTAPSALNTLNELAAALGDDANFSTTTSTALGNRLRVDINNQGLTGTQQANAITNLGITATKAELNFVDGVTSNIQTQLDGKQASGSYLTGNQTITLSGDVSGSGTTSISVTVADDSHNHIISNVDGLQTALDGKLGTTDVAANSQLLDSLDSTAFLRSNADDTMSEKLTFSQSGSTEFMETPGTVKWHSNGAGFLILKGLGQLRFEDDQNWDYNSWGGLKFDSSADIMYIGGPAASQFTSNANPPSIDVDFVGLNASGLKKDGNVVWHAGNDGSGSGLDADLLDGQHASAFLTGNQTITLTGDVSGSGTTSIAVTVADDSHNHIISNVDGLQTALDGKLALSGGTITGNLTLSYAYPRINLTDTNHDSDYSIINNDGAFSIYDVTNSSHRLSINSSGNATFAGQIHFSGSSSLRSNNIITFNTLAGAAQTGYFKSVAAQTSYANGVSDGMFNALNGYAVGTGTGQTVIDASRNITAGTISSGAITSTGNFYLDTSPAANGVGDLQIIPSANDSAGVGFAGQVLGVNISSSLSSNSPKQANTWGGVTGATAIALQADDNTYGQFQVWTSPQDSSANTVLTPRFYIAGNGNATFSGTISSGAITSSGNITVSGTVDGRDIATDGTKLDGIAANANNYSFPYTVSVSPSNNTVVQRHSSGYIYANYFNGTGTFNTTGITSGMALFTGTNGTDTFGRSYTAAAARALLNVENGATADQTAAEILTAIKTVDGSGSGLDADLLDGIQASQFIRNDTGSVPIARFPTTALYGDDSLGAFASSTFAVNPPRMGFFNINNSSAENPTGFGYWQGLHFRHNNQSSTWGWQLAGTYNATYADLYFRQVASASRGSWYKLWHTGNDGSGSGLDADLLDGQHGSYYLNYNNFTNTPTIPSLSGYATETYVNTQVSNLVDSAPGTLDTLNELAAALGDDANFSTTVTNSIATKLPLAGGTLTGALNAGGGINGLTLSNGISGNNFNITGVNQLTINDPGEGIVFGGGSTTMSLAIVDDATDRILRYSGTGAVFDVQGNITLTGTVTATGGNSTNWNTAYGWGNHASAGYITDGNTNWNNTYGFITSSDSSITNKMPLAGGTFTGGTTYNVAGDAITISSAAPQIRFSDTTSGADDFWIHVNSNIFYVLSDRDDSGSWETPHPLELHSGTNIGYTFGQRIFNEAYHPNADKWTTARTLSLTGAVTGSVSWDGSGNASIATTATADPTLTLSGDASGSATFTNLGNATLSVTVADDSHNHIISNVDGLQTALDAKLASSSYTAADVLTKIKTVDGSGSGLDADLLDSKDHTNFGATLATYGTTAASSGRIRCTAPFNTNSAHMFQVTVSLYGNYTCHTYVVSGYMYPTTNQWHAPKAIYTGTGSPDIVVGRNSSGKAYISIANGNYMGVRVHNMTRGYQTSVADTYDPWTITVDAATENSVTPTVSKVWHSTNDGSGSGLDADLLDGQQGSYYAPASTAVTLAGTQTITGTKTFDGSSSAPWRLHVSNASNSWDALTFQSTTEWGDGTTQYGVLGGDGTEGLMLRNPHIVWNSANAEAGIRLGRSGGTSSGKWVGMGVKASNVGFLSMQTTNVLTWDTSNNVNIPNGNLTRASNTVWDAGNDGSGSGLDADLLDGQHGSYYAPASHVHSYLPLAGGTVTGELNITSNTGVTGSSAPSYSNAKLEVQTSSNHVPAIAFHRGGYSATALYEYDGELYTNAWIARAQTGKLVSSGNIGSYAWTSSNDGSGSGLDADLLDGQHGSYYYSSANPPPTYSKYLRSDADDSFSGGLVSTARDEGIFGTYDSYKTDHIWSMGTGYKNHSAGTNFGNLYGLAYKHTNNTTGGTMGGGHQMVWCNNGSPRAAIGHDRFWHAASGTLWGSSNDGSGSGLDADTLDGIQGASLLRSDAADTASGVISFTAGHGALTITNSSIISAASSNWTGNPGGAGKIQYHSNRWYIVSDSNSNRIVQFRKDGADQSYIDNSGALIGGGNWYSGNDGSGSGLDADLLDGYQGSNYLGKNGNTYYQADNWIEFGGTYGLYVPTVNGAHLLPNTITSYGTWRTVGSRGGYDGIMFDGGGNMACMWDGSGNGGFYQQSGAGWTQYFHVGNSCTGFGASTTSSSYEIYVSGAIYSTGNITAYSDKRVKENIVPIDNALEKVNGLQGVYYNRIDDEDKTKEIGFIAQEVNEVAPELVTYAEDVDQYGVKYGNTTALLVEAVKELTQQVKDLKQEIEEIKNVK